MRLQVLAVYDSKAEGFLTPIFTNTTAQATRSFISAAADAGHDFHKFAGDYTLFEIGTFDASDAKFEIHPTPVRVMVAIEAIQAARQSNYNVLKEVNDDGHAENSSK
jgi:hypothetical protein